MKIIIFLLISLVGCTHTTRVEIAHAFVACAKQDGTVLQAVEAEYEKLEKILATGSADKWTQVITAAVSDGLTIGGCAFARVVASRTHVDIAGAVSRTAGAEDATAAFENYRAKYAGGATFELKEKP